MARLRLGTKLALLVLIPLLVLIGVGGPPLLDRWTAWKDAPTGSDDARLTIGLQELTEHLEREASLSSQYVATGDADVRRRLNEARPRTDVAARRVTSPAARSSDRETRRALREVETRWRAVQRGRAAIDRRTVSDLATSAAYEPSLRATRTARAASAWATTRVNGAPDESALRSALAALETATAHQQAILIAGIGRGSVSATVAAAAQRDAATEATFRDVILESFDTSAGPTPTSARDLRTTGRTIDSLRRIALTGAPNSSLAQPWLAATDRQLARVRQLARSLDRRAQPSITATREIARTELIRTAAITLGIGVIAMLVALALRRAIRRPIRSVAAHARAITAPEPPADITATTPAHHTDRVESTPVRTRDEIGDIDRALREIERTTADTISTQQRRRRDEMGDLYVTLARRNQPLLRRQLDAIGDIARTEPDTERQAALSTLGHLATRMRRNAESLLVLAGIDAHRSDPDAVPVGSIASDAVAEVEQFERVDIIGLPPSVAVTGRIAGDLTHVLAELIENAATYSPPDTRVFVSARRQLDGVEITVSDEGIGIPVDRLDDLNEVLSHPPLPGLDLSRSLGIIVIARLCERIGAHVSLRSAAEVGTTATVKLPGQLIVSPAGADDTGDDWVEPDRATTDPREGRVLGPRPEDSAAALAAPAPTTTAIAGLADGSLLSPVITTTPIPVPATPAHVPLPRRTPLAARPAGPPPTSPERTAPRPRSPQAVFELVARYESGARRAARRAPIAHQAPTPSEVVAAPPEEGH